MPLHSQSTVHRPVQVPLRILPAHYWVLWRPSLPLQRWHQGSSYSSLNSSPLTLFHHFDLPFFFEKSFQSKVSSTAVLSALLCNVMLIVQIVRTVRTFRLCGVSPLAPLHCSVLHTASSTHLHYLLPNRSCRKERVHQLFQFTV